MTGRGGLRDAEDTRQAAMRRLIHKDRSAIQADWYHEDPYATKNVEALLTIDATDPEACAKAVSYLQLCFCIYMAPHIDKEMQA